MRFTLLAIAWMGLSFIVLFALLQFVFGNEFTNCRCPKDLYQPNRTVTNEEHCATTTISCANAEGGVCEYPDPRGCVPSMDPVTKYCEGSENFINGGVGVMQLLGFILEVFAQIYWYFMVPETLRPTEKTEATAQEYVKQRKCDKFSMPWQNIRPVFATKLQRILMCGVIVFYCVESASEVWFAWWQEKHGFDSGQRGLLAFAEGFCALVMLSCVLPILIDKFGDYKGIWIPFTFFFTIQFLLFAIFPPQNGNPLLIILVAVITAPATLVGGAEGLLLKLVPMDIMATVKSGRAALQGIIRVIMPFVWWALYFQWNRCFDIANPMRSFWLILMFVMMTFVFVALIYFRKLDPKPKFDDGKGVEDFYNSDYAKGPWYKYHSSGNYEAFVKEYGDKAAESAMTTTLSPTNQVVVSSAPVVVVNSAPVIVQQPPVIVQQSTPVIVKQEIDA